MTDLRAPDGTSSLPAPERVPSFALADGNLVKDKLSGREWVAVCFAGALLLLIMVITGTLLWQWCLARPAEGAAQADAIVNYQKLTGLIDERIAKFFDITVTKALLPVFTTLIGFLLGRKSRND